MAAINATVNEYTDYNEAVNTKGVMNDRLILH